MEKIDTVMLDLDGVLVNFHQAVYKLFGQPWEYTTRYIPYDFWLEWDIKVTHEEIMKACDQKFWENLEWHHDGRDILYSVLTDFDINQIYILTNPLCGGTDAATGKMKWILREMPKFYRRTILTCAPKGLLAKPNVLLIDDNDTNIDDFKTSGGQTIQVPRPWNINHHAANDALSIVNIELRKLMKGNQNVNKQ